MNRTLCIDFDGTLCGQNHKPLNGVREVLWRFKNNHCTIVIASARLNPQLWGEQLHFRVAEIKHWLIQHDIPFDEVVVHKPPADIYIDDKGFHFEGDWLAAEATIRCQLGLA